MATVAHITFLILKKKKQQPTDNNQSQKSPSRNDRRLVHQYYIYKFLNISWTIIRRQKANTKITPQQTS